MKKTSPLQNLVTTLKSMPRYVKAHCYEMLEFQNSCRFGFALCLMESIFVGIYYYLSIYLVDTLHFDIPTSGFIISCYGVGAILGGIIGGRLSDLFSPSRISTLSLFIQAFAYFIFSIATSKLLLIVNVFILGIASYSFLTSNHLFILGECNDDENQRLKALSILAMISNLGLGISAVILGSILSIGFSVVFLITSILILILAAVSVYYEISLRKSNHQSFATREQSTNEHRPNKPDQPNISVFIMALSCVFFIGMIVTQSGATYAIYIKEIFPTFGIKAVTVLFAINSFIVVVASTIVCDLIKNYSKLLMLGIGGFLIGFGMSILTFSHLFLIAIVACIVNTIGEIIFFAVAQLICYQSGNRNKKGTSMGLYRAVYASSRALGPAAGSLIYYKTSGDTLWLICGAIGITALISCVLLNSWKSNFNIGAIENISTI